MSAATTLSPDDLVHLQRLLQEKDARIVALEARVQALEEYVRLSRQRQFGRSSEQSPPGQGELFAALFNEAELAEVAEAALAEREADANTVPAPVDTPLRRPGRRPLPKDLPRVRIEHELPEADRTCACGCERHVIGEETSEQLDIIPARVQVLVHVRKTYACRQCEGSVVTAKRPRDPIPKSNASPGTLAHIATAKYQDAQPLYRQEVSLDRLGIKLPRNTLAGWMIYTGEMVDPLIGILEKYLLAYPVLHCDETPLQVLSEDDRPATSTSYMWVRAGGPPTHPIRLFHYAPTRSGEVARALLEGFEGYLQTDDYAGYNGAAQMPGIIQLGCWAHARRKFVEAQKVAPKGKAGRADIAISMIQRLYMIEREIKELDAEAKHRIRQQKSVPQLAKIRQWLDDTLQNVLPKGALGKALAYLNKNWSKLTVYVNDGRLSIDNNVAENAIRPFVVGRKNWLFSSSVKGAKASANLYSLIETAKANGLEPYHYLKTVFERLPNLTTDEEIESLLPWNINRQDMVG